MAVTHSITLDVLKREGRKPQQVVVRVGDAGTQTISAAITKDGASYTSTYSTVRLDILHADGHWSRVTASRSGSTVTVTLPSAAVSTAGRCKLAHFVFYSGTSYAESTEGFELIIRPNVDASNADAAAQDYDDQLTALWEKWNAYESAAEQAEAARVSAEKTRASNEATRKSNESARQTAESSRAAAESARASAEATRKSNETARQAAESARASAEEDREDAEADRAEAESARQTAESSRAAAEEGRVTESATLKANAEKATAAANGAASTATVAANTCLEIANSVAQGSAGDSDIAALKAQSAALASKVADLEGSYFVMDTTIYAPAAKASVSGTAATVSSTSSISGSTVTLA